jgi:hypothetical protein
MKKISYLIILFLLFNLYSSHAQVTSLHEDFTSCVGGIPTGWTKYSVTGSDTWSCTTVGYVGKAVQMSGYSGGGNNTNEDWLISPLVNLNTTLAPMLSFWSRTKYAGNFIQVLISYNYAGTGNPNSATWTALPVVLPTSNSDVWFLSGPINLTAYNSAPMYIAFKYTSTTVAAATWKIDDVNINNGTLIVSKKFMNVGQAGVGGNSTPVTFTFNMSAISTSFDVDVPAPFEISKNGINYSNTLNYTSAAGGVSQTVYVRISPTITDKVYRKKLTFSYNGNLMNESIQLLGTSLPDGKTLRVFNWNMRWFGDPSNCACDTNLARLNATKLLKEINADIYCLQEIVNVNQIASITAALGPNYSYVVSPFCSGVTSPASGFYASCQKLGYIYNTNKIDNLGTFGLLASTYPADTSAYSCFSSGRFPFIFKAKLKLASGNADTVIFANIHAKASTTLSDYNRRVCGTQKMTDSLNALFPGKKVIVLGDFNDYLEGSAVTGQTVSPYQYLLNSGYTGITLPSMFVGQTTFVFSTDHIIDNVVASSALYPFYADSSCFIFTESESFIESYATTTSDHIPVMSYFKFNFPNGIKDAQLMNGLRYFNIVNPSSSNLEIYSDYFTNQVCKLRIVDITGKLLFNKEIHFNQDYYKESISGIQTGLYWVEISNGQHRSVEKWLVK